MSEFKREERYIVVKLKHLAGLQVAPLRNFLRENRVPTIDCVVVESDWPEYEPVWQMIERRMTGQPAVTAAEELEAVVYWRGKYGKALKVRDQLQRDLTAADERSVPREAQAATCKTCNGTRLVSDGAMHCSAGGIPFENGPMECVKDCPACKPAPSGITWRADGDANVYTLMRDGNWLASMRFNGELLTIQQEVLLSQFVGAEPSKALEKWKEWGDEASAEIDRLQGVEAERDVLKIAVDRFRAAFVIVVGDKSPFAKVALAEIDEAMPSSPEPEVKP